MVAWAGVVITLRQKPCGDGVRIGCPAVSAVVFVGVEAYRRWARVRTGGGCEEDMMLDPACKRDKAAHHAVEKLGKKLAQLFEAGGGGLITLTQSV